MAGISRAGSTAPQGRAVGNGDSKSYGLRYQATNATGGWEPSVMFLIALVIVEVVAYGALRYGFRGAHGG